MFRVALQRTTSYSSTLHLRPYNISTPYSIPWHISRYSTASDNRPDHSQPNAPPSSSNKPPDVHEHPSAEQPVQSTSSPSRDAQIVAVKERIREWSHETATLLRHRSDTFTRKVAVTFAQLGHELNRVTGYEEIEALKKKVAEQEFRITAARDAAKQAKGAYDTAVIQRAKSQREVNDLLQRKGTWTDADVSRFTELVRQNHVFEQEEARAKAAANESEDAVELEFSELMRVILNRYHEEQVWADKIRSASTYGSLAVLGINVLVFVSAVLFVEPWKRHKLAVTFEKKVEQMTADTIAAFDTRTDALVTRLDEQQKVLSHVAETVYYASQPPDEKEAVLAEISETVLPDSPRTHTYFRRDTADWFADKEVLVAIATSATTAGVIGWIACSWIGS